MDYLNCIAQIGFVSCINEYTRVTNNSHNAIDHIFIKNGYIDSIKPIILESYIRDHYCIMLLDKDNTTNNEEINNIKSNINIKLLNYFLIKEKSGRQFLMS